VAALAGVGAQGVGEAGHLLQGLEHRAEQRQAAGAAPRQAGPEKDEPARLAERADNVGSSGPRSWRNFHRHLSLLMDTFWARFLECAMAP
jgi:hypothetical protein